MLEAEPIMPDRPCEYCAKEWRRRRGLHLPTQRHGMIPVTPCPRIWAVRISHPDSIETVRPWIAYVEGRRLMSAAGRGQYVRRYKTEDAALRAGRLASEDRE